MKKLGREIVKGKLQEIKKKTDDWDNNRFSDFKFQAIARVNPKIFNEWHKHKGDADGNKALLGHNIRRRKRDLTIKHGKNVIGPR